MEVDTVLFVELADEIADLARPGSSPWGSVSGADHVHLDIARAQRCRDLEPDEARADHHRSLRS